MKLQLIAIGILLGMILEFAIIAINTPKSNIAGGCKADIDTTLFKPLKTNKYGNNN